ncbi:CDP-glycerol glycerophosphotransferase family protein [Streptomyces californicus]|uniref:CDP-glycerol glycerophosphotransferase family protein n=1 Tax=Streptomyces californicus TaxID=67351 RepID=A0ABD7D4X9_9ACTN|nr:MULTISPECIES: CDP-glycerol glycerophosphotransferase family protein [Streptomyces]QRV28001.1 CDP-glycerol glycerophosphotransferase family protein [Streptomyces californicus]QRV36334.1 CDP-glycerol glycerophosphotransferase family protein [Streptomyces californicus]QRV41400.1 CDP-glycerol glycerophosphotransferase family protein [Streptomyces californicus]QRV48157.1 CDP-glycerol glycerophosphotransferase family protein [Streptomyces californicus]
MKPLLSVVVPVHNVEAYLEDCLRSVADQTLDAIEVVMVDDGSTDGSGRIAAEFAARDARFRLVRQPNAGLSAARNTGVRHTTPGVPYLAFADSDDIVVHDAYERMTASLESTGSDLATGNVWRLTGQGRQQAWQYRWLTAARPRTHITRDPRLLADRVAWNKVFRRSFWDAHGFAFPEGRLYEDTPVMIPAHYLAGSVDVLREHVYYWRVREGSITRRRTDVTGVRDRIAACEQVSAFLGGRDAEQRRAYDASCLRDDFGYFLDGLPLGGEAYRSAFLEGAGAFADRAGAGALEGLPVELRVKWTLVRERRLDELLEVLAFERANGPGVFAVAGPPGRRRAVYPGVRGASARLARTDVPAVARLLEARWDVDGKLRLRGYAYLRNLPAGPVHRRLTVGVVRAERGRRVRPVPVRSVDAPEATVASGQELHDYDRAGFEMVLDPDRLPAPAEGGGWLVGLVLAGPGAVRRVAVRAPDAGADQPLVHDLGDGRRAVLDYRGGRLRLTVTRLRAVAEAHRAVAEGGALVVRGRVLDGARPVALLLTREGEGDGERPVAGERPVVGERPVAGERSFPRESSLPVERSFPVMYRAGGAGTSSGPARPSGGVAFSVRVPVAELADAPPAPHRAPREVEAAGGARWRARLLLPGGDRVPLPAAPDLPPPAHADAAGDLVLDLAGPPYADLVERTPDGGLRVSGTYAPGACAEGAADAPEAACGIRVVLRHETLREEVRVAEAVAGAETGTSRRRFSVLIAPPLAEGRWEVRLNGLPVRLLGSTAARPAGDEGGGGPVGALRPERRHGDRLTVVAEPGLPAHAGRSAYSRRLLRAAHHPARRTPGGLPLRDTVLYAGGDSPRAVHTELVRRGTETEHLWVTGTTPGRATPVPPGARAVPVHSADWYEALARSRRIVTDGQLPAWFERRPGQTVVQTWHGTPLGRFGIGLTDTLYADHQYLATLPRRSDQWSVLVSPSTFATPWLRRSLAYHGEVLEAGSPANDVLFPPDRDKAAEEVRRGLGLPEDHRIVLYAPTYRDHLAHLPSASPDRSAPGPYRWDPALDPRALARALGPGHTVLVRRHPRVTGALQDGPGVLDVSGRPGAAGLLLVADVLVTDYAGLMFDFALTGRPMLFHTYDLEHYRDTVRGFCLDFETRAPGPLLVTTDEVAQALRDTRAQTARHADAYESFRRDFCDLDDGGAAARVADRLLADPA